VADPNEKKGRTELELLPMKRCTGVPTQQKLFCENDLSCEGDFPDANTV
jgi:hypothetical protein